MIACQHIKTYSAKQLKYRAKKGEHVTRTQLASEALATVKRKYNGLNDKDRFYHVGNGEWVRVKRD